MTKTEAQEITEQCKLKPLHADIEAIIAGHRAFMQRVSQLLDTANVAIFESAKQGKYYTEVSINNDDEYRHVEAHFKNAGYRTEPNGDGYGQRVIIIRWGKE